MKTLKQLLKSKSHGIISITPDAKIFDALRLMAEKNVGALLVISSGQLTGVISERDYARKVVLKGKSSLDTPVREIMTESVICVDAEQNLEDCMALMTDKHVRHLPVLENGSLMGMLSIGDLVKEMISDQELTIKHLESYIHQ